MDKLGVSVLFDADFCVKEIFCIPWQHISSFENSERAYFTY
jgi:hypothetical protein